MSHQHRRYIRHHVRDLIATRRCMFITLPSGRIIRGDRATKVWTPFGTVVNYYAGGQCYARMRLVARDCRGDGIGWQLEHMDTGTF